MRFRRLQQPADCDSFPSRINTRTRRLLLLETTHTFFSFPLCPHVPLFSIPLLFFCPSAPSPSGLFLSLLKTLTYIYLHTQERSCTALAFSQQRDAILLLWDTGGFIFLFFLRPATAWLTALWRGQRSHFVSRCLCRIPLLKYSFINFLEPFTPHQTLGPQERHWADASR